MEDENSSKKLPDSAKLKGVFWPGMNLFDSATLEMKRMRNQRKDGSILQQMMASSAEVEPTEVSYNPDGEFRNSRNIFGPLSTENSPVFIPLPFIGSLALVKSKMLISRLGEIPELLELLISIILVVPRFLRTASYCQAKTALPNENC